MLVTLDGRRLETEPLPGCTLQALIDQVREEQLDDRLVVSVAVNGHIYVDAELEAGLTQSLEPDAQVDLESGDRCTVAADAFRSLAAQLDQVGQLQPEIADQLNGGQVAEAVRQIGESVQVWHACRSAVVQCSGLVGRNLAEAEYDGRNVQQHVSELVEKLQELRDALEARDTVLLADLTHYEMPALCESWRDLLTTLADGIAGDAWAPE